LSAHAANRSMVKRQQQTFTFDDTPAADGAGKSPAAGPDSVSARRTVDGKAGESGPSVGPDTDQVPDRSVLSAESLDDLKGQSVYVIDAHSLIYQVFHAMPDMSGPTGQPVGATHGFVRDILDLLKNNKPNFLFCAFDHPGGQTFRNDLFNEYKANRDSMPEDLRPQIADIQRVLQTLGIPILVIENYEADDILATVAAQTAQRGGICCLVTGDKDCRQLITDDTTVFNIRKNEHYDAKQLFADWGVRPDQVVDFQSLVGDAVDNVPGVPLIGPKLARELLEKYETLDRVLDHAEEVSGKKRRENLINFRKQALMSRDLVRLLPDVPIEVDWAAGRVGGFKIDETMELCREFGFRQLADRLAQLTQPAAPATWTADYQTIDTVESLRELVKQLSNQPQIVVDTETTSTNPRWAEIVGYSFAWEPGSGFYVPVRAPAGERHIEPQVALDMLRAVLEDPAIAKVGQNIKYDIIVLRNVGVRMAGVAFDTMVADYLLDPGERNHSLDDLSRRYLNHRMIKISELIGSGKKQRRMDEVPVSEVAEYAAEDADVPVRLIPILERRLVEERLDRLFRDLEMPLTEVLAELEFNGIKVDVDLLAELGERFGRRLDALQVEIYKLAGCKFNIDSRQQLGKILFEDLQLPVVKKTKTGPSTDVEVLTQLATQHQLPAKVIEFRQFSKLKSTYVDALPALVHPETGRIHTSFKQNVAATGRLSSTEPNLQNIPIRTQEGREIRSAFLPGNPNWLLVCADYSQIELRVLAHFSMDPALQSAFAEDRDIHRQVASEVYGVPIEEVTSEQRRNAKAVNFGVIYGQSPFGLAKALDIDKADAAHFIDTYFITYAGVDVFMQKVLEDCRQKGYVETILGRRRTVHGVRDPSRMGDSRQRNLPERIAINTVIQGSAADLIKLAMIRVHNRLREEQLQARMLLQIHDELVFEAPPEELAMLASLVVKEMTSVGDLNVPLKVEPKAGPNWAECESLE
jgi:DNA polymerase-1